MKGLIIVESPGKVKKIQKFVNQGLGPGFTVAASVGHIRDLPAKELGIEGESYRPRYEVSPKKKQVVARLKQLASSADAIYLATDPDREGEAIAWHLSQVLGKREYKRVIFNEITAKAVIDAFSKAGKIDFALVEAQETRRVLDRLVGYRVTPALRQREGSGLTAGRVQSVAVRLVDTRRQEIDNFVPVPYLDVSIKLDHPAGPFKASLITKSLLQEGQTHFNNKDLAQRAAQVRQVALSKAVTEPKKVKAPPPLITSTMQQLGSTALGFSSKETMSLAQSLFEAGLITYHRTDFPNLSEEGVAKVREVAEVKGWPLPETSNKFNVKGDAQAAHEAIRPTDFGVEKIPSDVAGEKSNPDKLQALYELIWNRAVSCQLADGIDDVTRYVFVDSAGSGFEYESKGAVEKVKGWRVLHKGARKEDAPPLPALSEGAQLAVVGSNVDQKETKPPSLYDEAKLIAKLEKEGVGRPSTYASILDKIFTYGYVEKVKKQIDITPLGHSLVKAMSNTFSFMDVAYTRQVEERLDDVASRKDNYLSVVSTVDKELSDQLTKFGQGKAVTEQFPCESCGKPMRRIKGSKGFFWGCTGYQDGCKSVMDDHAGKPVKKGAAPAPGERAGSSEKPCPSCKKGKLQKRKGSNGPFYGCSNYPECRHTAPVKSRRRAAA